MSRQVAKPPRETGREGEKEILPQAPCLLLSLFNVSSLGGLAPWRLPPPPLLLLVAACGYHSVYSAGPQGKLHVALLQSLAPDAVAADEVVSGAREELARAGALAAGDGYPRLEIEVLRADEASEGILATARGPVARGTDVSIVARAWVLPSPGEGAEHVTDTGDVRTEESITVDSIAATGLDDPRAAVFHRTDARRAAARRLGRKLAARVLGQPASSEDVQ